MILLGDLILLEIFLIFLYLIFRIPSTYFVSLLNMPGVSSLEDVFSFMYFIFLSIIELILITTIVLKWVNEEYEIRDDTIVHRKGVFSRTEENYSLRNLGNATISQSLLGRLFNFGTVKVYSPLLKQEYYISNVHNPKQILTSLEDDLSEKGSETIIKRG